MLKVRSHLGQAGGAAFFAQQPDDVADQIPIRSLTEKLAEAFFRRQADLAEESEQGIRLILTLSEILRLQEKFRRRSAENCEQPSSIMSFLFVKEVFNQQQLQQRPGGQIADQLLSPLAQLIRSGRDRVSGGKDEQGAPG